LFKQARRRAVGLQMHRIDHDALWFGSFACKPGEDAEAYSSPAPVLTVNGFSSGAQPCTPADDNVTVSISSSPGGPIRQPLDLCKDLLEPCRVHGGSCALERSTAQALPAPKLLTTDCCDRVANFAQRRD